MRLHKIEKGRYVLYFGKDYGDSQIRWEFSRKYNFGLGFKISREERDLQFSVHAWKLFSVWLTFENKHLKYSDDLTILGFNWQTPEHVIRIQLMDYSEMDSSEPYKISTYWNYRDFLLGRSIHSESRHREADKVPMVMPEGTYMVKMDYWTSYWHRPRSPFVRSIERVEMTPEKPVPTPGKGENSWDLDDDATYSITMPVNGRTPEELVEDFKQSTLERRERYGGRNWEPSVDSDPLPVVTSPATDNKVAIGVSAPAK
jgi:hypothetical protein